MSITTLTQIAGPVDVDIQQTLLRVAKARCPYFLGSMPGTIQSHSGTFTVKWRRYDELTPTVSALSELTGSTSYPTRTATQLSVTDVTATVSKYGDHAIFSEEVDLKNLTHHSEGVATAFGIQAGRSLNRLQRNELEDNATMVYASGASADANVADAITYDLIESVANTLEGNSAMTFNPRTTGSANTGTVPIDMTFWGFCHTHVKADIRKLTGFEAVEKYAGQTSVANGEFGRTGDVRWISTPEASADVSSGGNPGSSLRSTNGTAADLYTSVVIGMDAHGSVSLDTSLTKEVYNAGDDIPGIIMISKERGSAGTADPLNELSSVGWKAWAVPKILNANWIRAIRTGARKLQ